MISRDPFWLVLSRTWQLYLSKFTRGLELYGLGDIIRQKPEICKALFVMGHEKDVDANYVFPLMKPCYSVEGSTRKDVEESVMDSFQDVSFGRWAENQWIYWSSNLELWWRWRQEKWKAAKCQTAAGRISNSRCLCGRCLRLAYWSKTPTHWWGSPHNYC